MQTYTGTPTADVQRRIEWNPNDPNLLQMTLPGGLEVGMAGGKGWGWGGGGSGTQLLPLLPSQAAPLPCLPSPDLGQTATLPQCTSTPCPLPGQVSTRVTRRSEELQEEGARLNTSEYFQQLINSPERAQPKVGRAGGCGSCGGCSMLAGNMHSRRAGLAAWDAILYNRLAWAFILHSAPPPPARLPPPCACLPQVKASQCFTKYHWRSAGDAAAGSAGGVQIVATQVGRAHARLPACLPDCMCLFMPWCSMRCFATAQTAPVPIPHPPTHPPTVSPSHPPSRTPLVRRLCPTT